MTTVTAPSDTAGDLERELLCALGWGAPLGRPLQVDLELIADPRRRLIGEMLLRQHGQYGAATWASIHDELAERVAGGDPLAHDAMRELAEVLTAGGWPSAVPVLTARLEAAAERRRRWSEAVRTIEELGGRVDAR